MNDNVNNGVEECWVEEMRGSMTVRHKVRVLVVGRSDDLESMLACEPALDVHYFCGGWDALDWIREHHEMLDMVVIKDPVKDFDSLRFVNFISLKWQQLKLVFVSADNSLRPYAIAEGADEFVKVSSQVPTLILSKIKEFTHG